ncbi:MAG TPA: fibronectin type III domain-containing protein, partial [Steroidobacteraceae bacterium]
MTLNWTAPTENTNGSPLTNLAGYNIHYGTASGDYSQTVSVSNPGLATYVVDNLGPGTYYFSVGAVSSS